MPFVVDELKHNYMDYIDFINHNMNYVGNNNNDFNMDNINYNDFNMSSFKSEGDFFEMLYLPRPSKFVIMTAAFTLVFVNLILLYGVVWFERFGSDLKRTLINKFVASICWATMVIIVFGHGLTLTRFALGPLPRVVCFIRTLFLSSSVTSILIFMDGILVAKFFYVFVLKNPAALQDDFW